MRNEWLLLVYLLAGCLFIAAIRGLASPQTARFGNRLGIAGMAIAVTTTLGVLPEHNLIWILSAMFAGGVIGVISGLKVKITALPQMIAAFNGLGGLASALIGLAEVWNGTLYPFQVSVGIVIGSITFSGSVIAFAKLHGVLRSDFGAFSLQNVLNVVLLFLLTALWAKYALSGSVTSAYLLALTAMLLGALMTLPVGGADMPIIISVLNACSGWAAAGIGFSLANVGLIITGALIGASGTILAFIMTKVINRSLFAMVFGRKTTVDKTQTLTERKSVHVGNYEDAAFVLENASKVIIIPGYGMAAAQAQHALQTMANILKTRFKVNVKFAVHPVAGRMPGHMNVLLAEANVPYDDVLELDEANHELATADAAYVIGANDITNPAARTDRALPIYGMPVLEVEKAKTVFFVKRSLGAGYSGVDNPLFYADNTIMLYGDAKKVSEDIVRALEQN